MTRIAVAGAGLIGREHIARIAASPTCTLASIVDPLPAVGRLASEHRVPRFADLTTMIRQDRPDGVILATPDRLHFENALEYMAAGLPMLLEKPAADSLAAAEDLLRAADERRAVVLVGHHRIHSPIMRLARAAIDEGVIGRVVAVAGTALFFKPDDYFDTAWRREPGGGPVLINLIHEISNLRMLCGEITEVEAITSNAAVRGFAVEDTAAIIAVFASGALGSFLVSDTAASGRSWEQTSQENPAYVTYPDEDCYHITGTMGSLSVPTMRIKRYDSPGQRSWSKPMRESVPQLAREDPLSRQLEHFGAVVRGEEAPRCSLRDVVMNVSVVEAISKSARTGRRAAVSAP